AAAFWIEQRRAADHRQRCLGLAVDHLQPDAGLARDPLAKTLGIGRGAASLGRVQPQAARLAITDLVAADRKCRDGAVDRRLADGTGRRDALAEANDPRKRVDHAKSLA